MKPRALVLLAEGFEEIEAVGVIDILRRAQCDTLTASLDRKKKTVAGAHGIAIIADTSVSELNGFFDAVVLPGGMPGADNLASSEAVKALLEDHARAGKLIAAMCASPAAVLAPLGLLDARQATCYPGFEGAFHPTTRFIEQDVVRDGNIITSRGPGTAMAFALSLVESLCGQKTAGSVRSRLGV